MENSLDDRYGRKRNSKRDRITVFTIAGVFLAAFLVWAVSISLTNASQASSRDISYEILSNTSAQVVFEVSRDPGDAVICSIQALNESFAVVGYKELEIAPSRARSTVISADLLTTEKAVSGLVDSCRVK
jgi:hypothetical protein